MGFWFNQDSINKIKDSRNTKVVFLQCGNQFIENSMRSVHNYEKVEYVNNYLIAISNLKRTFIKVTMDTIFSFFKLQLSERFDLLRSYIYPWCLFDK